MWTKIKFIILLIILFVLFLPLIMMFFTSVIPEGDPFHIVMRRKIQNFQLGSSTYGNPQKDLMFLNFFLKKKISTIGNANWRVEAEKNGNFFMSLSVNGNGGVGIATGNKNINVVRAVQLKIKTESKMKLRIGFKDATEGRKQFLPVVDVDTGGVWKTMTFDIDLSKLSGIDRERVSRIYFSFSGNGKVYLDDLYFLNRFPAFYNFVKVVKYDMFGRYLINSAIISLAVVAGNMIFSSMVGYAFARKRFFLKEALFAVILGMMMIPPQTTIIPVFILMKKIGWIDTYWALIVPALVTPFGIFLMRQYIEQIPKSLDEAARVDGASDWQIFWRIIMPLSKAPLAVLGINVFIGAWNDLFYPLILTTSKEMRTIQLGLAMYQKLNTDWPSLMAASTIAGLPVMIVYLIFQKRIIAGVLQGAVKG